jgi:hypothetical protein
MMKAFVSLAKEICRKIEVNEIDPKNELLGVKLGNYRQKNSEQPKRMCC